jgi:oligopeptide transport system substrate-binding protein
MPRSRDLGERETEEALVKVARGPTLVLVALVVVSLGSACGGPTRSAEDPGTITFALPGEPSSLDPALGTDTVSAQVTMSIMDPLVVLRGKPLKPVPNLASGWTVSDGGKIYTIRLRRTGRWTNGLPVTAHDYEYSWKRELDPNLGAEYAHIMYGIKGALAYNTCKENCARLRDQVGVTAIGDYTIGITLQQREPWFPQLLAHNVFFAVPRVTVERYGDKWTEPSHIVTNGPFRLTKWQHGALIELTKWNAWRDANSISIERVDMPMIAAGAPAAEAFQAGDVDALSKQMLGPADIPRWKGTPAYYESPQLATNYIGINVKKVTDVDQRRAMAMAIDRRALIDQAILSGTPADGFTPEGIPGFESIDPHSRFLPADGNLVAAKALMRTVTHPIRKITLDYPNAPGVREGAVAVAAMWQQLGISTTLHQEQFNHFLHALGPPPDADVDTYLLGWIYDFPDAINGLELWTCRSPNNSTNRCNERYDSLIAHARPVQDTQIRYRLYRGIEQAMFGPNGDMPLIPLYWGANVSLVDERIRGSFQIDPQTFVHFDEIKVSRR